MSCSWVSDDGLLFVLLFVVGSVLLALLLEMAEHICSIWESK